MPLLPSDRNVIKIKQYNPHCVTEYCEQKDQEAHKVLYQSKHLGQ